ncbi:MAG: sensor histidine kinase [Actinomycetota bacterium]
MSGSDELAEYLDNMTTFNAKVAPDGSLLFVNSAAERASGMPRTELMRTGFLDGPWWAFDPKVQARVRAAFARAVEGEHVGYDERISTSGGELWIDFSLTPVGDATGRVKYVVAEGHDVTARKEVEAALSRSQARFRQLLEHAPDATIGVRSDGIIVLANLQAEGLFGRSRDELIGTAVEDLIPLGSRPAHQAHRRRYFGHPEPRPMGRGLDLRARRSDGSEFPVEISLSALTTDDELVALAAVRDITDRRRVEDEMRRANGELEAFAYSVSHDLRAPLRAMDGFARIIEEEHTDEVGETARRYLGRIRINAQRMGQLIDDLLAFSRIGRQQPTKHDVDPARIVAAALRDLESEREGRDVEIVLDELPRCVADPALLELVFLNLLSNALKYTRGRADARIEVGAIPSGDGSPATFFVRDNGVGFDMRYADKLFGVFQRLHPADRYEGTGVGLATVQRVVERHGGRVWADAAPDRGATFFFTLTGGNDVGRDPDPAR